MQHSNTAGCILLKFYIKPQHTANVYNLLYVVSYRNSTSNHNTLRRFLPAIRVVSYRNSTSNHNSTAIVTITNSVVSYRNSTSNHNAFRRYVVPAYSCILSKFYIKPQQNFLQKSGQKVVSYRNSTSNHNGLHDQPPAVVVVSYRNSTSNHNKRLIPCFGNRLYLIEILHQTTTLRLSSGQSCQLYLIEILHQTTTLAMSFRNTWGCILSKFYIKPQRTVGS